MKVLTIAGVSILALGLVLGVALPGLAAPGSAIPWADDSQAKMVRGKVLYVDEENQEFVIQSGEQELTISVDDDTKYYKLCVPGRIVSLAWHRMEWRHQNQEEIGAPGWHGMGLGLQNQERNRVLARHQMRHQIQIPQLDNGNLPEPGPPKLKWLRPFGEESEFSDIAVGDRVVVWLAAEEDNLAKRVLIVKPTTYARVSGTIDVSLADETITIVTDGGAAVPLSYNEGTVFILKGIIQVKTGQSAHAIYDSDNLIAKRVIVHQ